MGGNEEKHIKLLQSIENSLNACFLFKIWQTGLTGEKSQTGLTGEKTVLKLRVVRDATYFALCILN